MSKTYHIQTYGCQMNVADSELVESILVDQGYKSSNDPNTADVIFINTCSIREHAEDKVHSQLGRYELIKKKQTKYNNWCFRVHGPKFKTGYS